MLTLEEIKKISKAELHVHLDGSLRIGSIIDLAKKQDISLSNDQIKSLQVSKNCQNLNEYLKAFEIPVKVLQTKGALKRCVKEVLEDLKNDGVILAEIRFAPGLHINNGMSQEEVLRTVIEGMNEVSGINAELILCCMRAEKEDFSREKINIETVSLAKKYFKKGVCGLDLAGAEALYPVTNHYNLFELANKYNIPFTIHAGEADGPISIWNALKIGAKRIGHGVTSIEDETLIQKLIDEDIVLEMCPTSNCHTKAVKSFSVHPIKELLEKGVKVTVNTDNRTVSNITLSEELFKLQNELGLTKKDIETLIDNSFKGSFILNRKR